MRESTNRKVLTFPILDYRQKGSRAHAMAAVRDDPRLVLTVLCDGCHCRPVHRWTIVLATFPGTKGFPGHVTQTLEELSP